MIISKVRKLFKYIGPYPYNPYLLFLFFFSFYFSRYIRVVGYLPAGPERWRAGGLVLLASAVPAIIFSLGSILITRFRFWSSKSTAVYILEVAGFQYLNLLYLPFINRFLQKKLNYYDKTIIALSKNIFIASLVLVLVALAVMHQAERKISERLLLANKLVDKLENERAELVHSEEALRKQTSQFLHDRVQSDLMVIGMKLKSISGLSTPEVNEVIDRAIVRLENTRAADLKNLIQILTPNLDAGTLSSALDTLMEQYRQTMDISVEVDTRIETLDAETKLGLYRIIEQAVLNSLIHGPATRVQVKVDSDVAGISRIIVADDGPGATLDEVSPGVGSAIIDSWVGILGGKRSIDTSSGYGYRLEISIPVQ